MPGLLSQVLQAEELLMLIERLHILRRSGNRLSRSRKSMRVLGHKNTNLDTRQSNKGGPAFLEPNV